MLNVIMYKEKYYFWLIAVITTTGKWQQTSSDAHQILRDNTLKYNNNTMKQPNF